MLSNNHIEHTRYHQSSHTANHPFPEEVVISELGLYLIASIRKNVQILLDNKEISLENYSTINSCLPLSPQYPKNSKDLNQITTPLSSPGRRTESNYFSKSTKVQTYKSLPFSSADSSPKSISSSKGYGKKLPPTHPKNLRQNASPPKILSRNHPSCIKLKRSIDFDLLRTSYEYAKDKDVLIESPRTILSKFPDVPTCSSIPNPNKDPDKLKAADPNFSFETFDESILASNSNLSDVTAISSNSAGASYSSPSSVDFPNLGSRNNHVPSLGISSEFQKKIISVSDPIFTDSSHSNSSSIDSKAFLNSNLKYLGDEPEGGISSNDLSTFSQNFENQSRKNHEVSSDPSKNRKVLFPSESSGTDSYSHLNPAFRLILPNIHKLKTPKVQRKHSIAQPEDDQFADTDDDISIYNKTVPENRSIPKLLKNSAFDLSTIETECLPKNEVYYFMNSSSENISRPDNDTAGRSFHSSRSSSRDNMIRKSASNLKLYDSRHTFEFDHSDSTIKPSSRESFSQYYHQKKMYESLDLQLNLSKEELSCTNPYKDDSLGSKNESNTAVNSLNFELKSIGISDSKESNSPRKLGDMFYNKPLPNTPNNKSKVFCRELFNHKEDSFLELYDSNQALISQKLPCYAKATLSYESKLQGRLKLSKGDMVYITDRINSEWVLGSITASSDLPTREYRSGIFPSYAFTFDF
ncbi:hypothetical protein AYI68_g6459 [Smittium mucronatum]|uniref:SH3 domain-containing protein n=1 Tax=Smittium mucronatum TaxID=133383 RepID=A0A1R0GRE9_9FUNG|nr:hypothetical protein AYI68_g6459 [Smittium mucronatum]